MLPLHVSGDVFDSPSTLSTVAAYSFSQGPDEPRAEITPDGASCGAELDVESRPAAYSEPRAMTCGG